MTDSNGLGTGDIEYSANPKGSPAEKIERFNECSFRDLGGGGGSSSSSALPAALERSSSGRQELLNRTAPRGFTHVAGAGTGAASMTSTEGFRLVQDGYR